jgi:hypothetical protein
MAASASTHVHVTSTPRAKQPFRSLDDLLYLGPEDLAHLYRTAETPRVSDRGSRTSTATCGAACSPSRPRESRSRPS